MAAVIGSNTRGRQLNSSLSVSQLIIFVQLLLLLLLSVQGSEACYKFADDVRDPCLDVRCQFGADCLRSKDGKKAECVCPQKCYTYGDSVGVSCFQSCQTLPFAGRIVANCINHIFVQQMRYCDCLDARMAISILKLAQCASARNVVR